MRIDNPVDDPDVAASLAATWINLAHAAMQLDNRILAGSSLRSAERMLAPFLPPSPSRNEEE